MEFKRKLNINSTLFSLLLISITLVYVVYYKDPKINQVIQQYIQSFLP